MFKELLWSIISFLLVCISILSSAEAQLGNSKLEKLESGLNAYKESFRSGDYTRAASMVSPNMINKVGGKENFARLIRKFTDSTIITLKPSLVEFSKPGEIVSDDNIYISVIRQIIPITTKGIDEDIKDTYLLCHPTFPARVFEGMDGVFNMSIIAYSKDEGNTWFFTGGNRMSLSVENIKPEILEKINIPVHTLIFGEGSDKITLYRQNKQWVRIASGISDGLAEESIIFTIGEQMDDSLSNMARQDVPDDSLDAYIYLEEHPVVPIVTSEEADKQARNNSIKKGSENKHKPSRNISHSVYVTKESNIFHKPDCPELRTGNFLEFDSTEEALKSGGVPCEHCNQ
ncbi:MAG: hypothetical protein K8F52_13080 [Candidatus Scalindua rubra]|uniref:Ada DNA repair metal-binding domain-containing protein n=1 Tax=Candidatus Scalindua brodae TaxID=237368 RepID=A0A0B0EH63_9BACT|nr:MAG: hypothetical protein SCABRO_03838 [Candidatus Scalindua brodae]MBZ0109594.1 hypothetical protein [Candidatus Scalindua rubra]TWU33153.1 hypothetical protein S225a_16050 [Candidatus Brocadiaceae bacterium S225]